MIHLAYADILVAVACFGRSVLFFSSTENLFTCVTIMGLLILATHVSETLLLVMAVWNCLSIRNITKTVAPETRALASSSRTQLMALTIWVTWTAIILWGSLDIDASALTIRDCLVANSGYRKIYSFLTLSLLLFHIPLIVLFHVIAASMLNYSLSKVDGGPDQEINRSKLHIAKKMTKLVFAICVIFSLTWIPLSAYLLIFNTIGGNPALILYLGLLPIFNSISNIFIYTARSKEFRIALRKVVFSAKIQNKTNTTDTAGTSL